MNTDIRINCTYEGDYTGEYHAGLVDCQTPGEVKCVTASTREAAIKGVCDQLKALGLPVGTIIKIDPTIRLG